MFDDESQVRMVQSMADIVASNALATANFFEARTKQTLNQKKKAAVGKKKKRSKTQSAQSASHNPFEQWIAGAEKMSATMTGSDTEDGGAFNWMSPDYWEGVTKPGPSPLQTLAEPAFGSFAGLDWAAPFLSLDNKMPDFGGVKFSSPADFFDVRYWIPKAPAPMEFGPTAFMARNEPDNPVEAFWGAWGNIAAQSMKPMMDMMMASGMQAAQKSMMSNVPGFGGMGGAASPMWSTQSIWSQPFGQFTSPSSDTSSTLDPFGLMDSYTKSMKTFWGG